jgi:hypothetical protein
MPYREPGIHHYSFIAHMLVKSYPSPIFQGFQGTTCFDSWKDAVVPGHTDLWAMQRLREQSRPIEERRYRFCPWASLGIPWHTGSYWILLDLTGHGDVPHVPHVPPHSQWNLLN